MSTKLIRTGFMNTLESITPSIDTAKENVEYTPILDIPFQRVLLNPSKVQNPTFGDNYYRESGEFIVFLNYPLYIGTGDIEDRAELIQNKFYRGLTIQQGSVEIQIQETPSILIAGRFEDRYILPIKIKYFCNILK